MDFHLNNKKFQIVVCGGTFDHFHKGHKSFLKHALSISEKIIIGITSDRYIKKVKIPVFTKVSVDKQNSKVFEDFRTRKMAVENFLKKKKSKHFEIIKIDNMFGTTLNQNFFADAIIVSKNTKTSAEKINEERVKKNLSQFKIVISSQILAQDAQPISSFRIRNGEIDKEGKLFVKPLWLKNTLVLPQNFRGELKKPLGILIKKIDKKEIKDCNYLITVGDETTKIFNSLSLKPNIAVVDFKIARIKQFSNIKEIGFAGKEKIIDIKNPSGHITPELFKTIFGIFKKKQKDDRLIIKIDGEDDLSVLPLVLAAPLGSCIFYGQPDQVRLPSFHSEANGEQGIVKITIDEKTKNKMYKIVDGFSTRGY